MSVFEFDVHFVMLFCHKQQILLVQGTKVSCLVFSVPKPFNGHLPRLICVRWLITEVVKETF